MNRLITRSITGLTLLTLCAGLGGIASAEVGGTITRSLQPVLINAPVVKSAWLGHWSEPALASLIERGLLSTRYLDDQRQTPETQVTVAEAAHLLLAIGRFPMAADRNVIDQAVEHGIIQAADFAEEKVDAEAVISREQFALWTARATGQKMMAEFARIYMTPDFADVDAIGAPYRNAVALLQGQSILAGDGASNFAPQRTLSLAEGVQILYNTHAALDAVAAKAVGTYGAERPADAGPSRSASLELKADGTFLLRTDEQNGAAPVEQAGSWRPEHADMLSLRLTNPDGEQPITLSARLTENGVNILPQDFDQDAVQLVRQ